MTAAALARESRSIPFLLQARARQTPDATFLTCGANTLTYGECVLLVERIAAALHDAGIRKGDRVGAILPNGIEFVLTWFASSWLGAVFVPLNPTYKGHLLDYVIGDSVIRILVAQVEMLPLLEDVGQVEMSCVEQIFVVDREQALRSLPNPLGALPFDALTAHAGSMRPATVDPLAPNCVMYTSGTTGASKGVVLSSSALLVGSGPFIEIVGLHSRDVLYTPLPLFHGIASRQGVLPCLIQGAHVVLGDRFSASRFWQQVVDAKATLAHTMFNLPAMLKAQPEHPAEKQHRLRAMYNAAFDEEFERRFNVPLLEGYGLIETGMVLYSAWGQRVKGTCGTLSPLWEATLVDAAGEVVAAGAPGELLLRPREPGLLMDGYLNKPAETLERYRNLWFHTGDYLSCDERGNYSFAGRQQERIRRRGENISALEIEQIAARYPAIELCAAVGFPADVGDDDVRLVVSLRKGAEMSPEALHAWLAARLPAFMVPRYIEIVESFVLTPTHKIRKNVLIDAGLGPSAWDHEGGAARNPEVG